MGLVFEALDTQLERTVALKVLRSGMEDRQGADAMIREARTASALNHPNIVTIYEVIRTGSRTALVMEFVSGRPLRALIGEPVDIVSWLRILYQIADALRAAHTAGIVHRDIKPENVIVREDGHVKVLDFGLARCLDNDVATSMSSIGMLAGTLRYLPPERWSGAPLSAAGDIFSLGVVFYEAVTGRHPFPAGSAFESMQAILTQQPEPPATHSHGLDALILSMLAKAPADRPSAAEVLQRLNDIQGGIPIPLSSGSVRRRSWWLPGAAAALLLLAAVLGAAYWKRSGHVSTLLSSDRITKLLHSNRATAAAISGDGRYGAYANSDGIFLRAMNTNDTQQLQAPPDFVVDRLAWYPDGTRMAVSGFSESSFQPGVWMVPVVGAPRLMRDHARSAVPSPDGRSLAFLSEDRSEIRVLRENAQEISVLNAQGTDTFSALFWSPQGQSILFQRHHESRKDRGAPSNDRFRERSLESVDVQSGRIVFQRPDFWYESAASLSDGRIRFLRFSEPGSYYSYELSEVRADPRSGAFQGEPVSIGRPVQKYGGYLQGITQTDDGKQMLVIQSTDQHSVFVADVEGNPPRFANSRQLTLDSGRSFPHAWTLDSRTVILESEQSGSWDIYRQRIDQRVPIPIVSARLRAEVLAQLTPDGQSILYAAAPTDNTAKLDTVLRVPLSGGPSVPIVTGDLYGEFRCSVGTAGRCVLRRNLDNRYFSFHELDPLQGVGAELARTEWLVSYVGDWDISPDGTQIAVPQHDSRSAVIRLISLSGKKESRVSLPALSDIHGVAWSADGTGWYVSLATSVGDRTVYVTANGKVTPLGALQATVPSPNGRRVAYVDHIVVSDVWFLQLQ